MPVALAIDIGTSSVRASLWDERGDRVGDLARIETTPLDSAAGLAQFDADSLAESVEAAIDAVLLHAGADACRIVAVGTSCFWHSLVGVDDRGAAVTSVSSWADTRAHASAAALRARTDERAYHRRTGAMLHSSYPVARIAWLTENADSAAHPVAMWMSFADYLRLRLFGREQTGLSMASGSGLLEPNAGDWDAESLELAGISPSQVPAISEEPVSGLIEPYARRWPAVALVPWFPAVGDGACATVGSGCSGPDRMALSLGTSGALRVALEAGSVEIPDGLFAYRIDRRRWVAGGALSEGGGFVEWLCSMYGIELDEGLDASVAGEPPDGHGLTILPFVSGERSPGWRDTARCTISGLSGGTRPVAIVRAALESIAFRFKLIAERLSDFAPDAREIVGSGGALAASATWRQILADVLERRLAVPSSSELSSRGAALLALEAAGVIDSTGGVPTAVATVIEPDPSLRDVYRAAASRQQKLYDALIP